MLNLRALGSRASRDGAILHRIAASQRQQVLPGKRRQHTEAVVDADERILQCQIPTASGDSADKEAWLFVDSVFPVRLGSWDFRHYIGLFREDTLLGELGELLSGVKTNNFKALSLEPHIKDGGVFVRFSYTADDSGPALDSILNDLRAQAKKAGGVPSWHGFPWGKIWLVKGRPWREDMNRFASPIVQVAYEGPDVKEEILFRLLRPFGRIQDISPPSIVPAGQLRSSVVQFKRLRSATVARNTIHGTSIPSDFTSSALTTLRTSYQQPIQAHAIRDYVTSHPRIFLPVLFFLLGTLTYTVFDPIRILSVESKMSDWFNYREFALYKWIRENTLGRFSFVASSDNSSSSASGDVWQERKDAEIALQTYLSDIPNTVLFVHGPQGSGKSRMLNSLLDKIGRKALVIDVRELGKANSETKLVSALAQETGYWPVFSFMNSLNNLIDMASQGLIGQKAGLSSTLREQLKQILEVTGLGLARLNTARRKQRQKAIARAHVEEVRKADEAQIRARIVQGRWHDGRLDCVAGNGIMSELGVGDEYFGEDFIDVRNKTVPESEQTKEKREETNENARRQRSAEDIEAVESMPIVVIQGFESKSGAIGKEDVLDVLTEWTVSLLENKVAHVIVVSDNRENAKRLAKAFPTKPLNVVTLSDADSRTALSFVEQKLRDVQVNVEFTPERVAYIQRLGGRASDLESLIHKVRSGQTIEAAVEDIITRGVSELRKSAFGDDIEDSKTLSWSREQAWTIVKKLAQQEEISYHEAFLNFPFKGDDNALRGMEHAELITIGTQEGRPTTIKPGKPIYKYVFQRLVNDRVFQATQDFALNEKLIANAEAMVKNCEQELLTLATINKPPSSWWSSKNAVEVRSDYLTRKMRQAAEIVDTLDKQNAILKKVVSAGEQ